MVDGGVDKFWMNNPRELPQCENLIGLAAVYYRLSKLVAGRFLVETQI
jgi:hypothetical protein